MRAFEASEALVNLVLPGLAAVSGVADVQINGTQEKLFQILNHRYNAQLPLVITTNHRLEDLQYCAGTLIAGAGGTGAPPERGAYHGPPIPPGRDGLCAH